MSSSVRSGLASATTMPKLTPLIWMIGVVSRIGSHSTFCVYGARSAGCGSCAMVWPSGAACCRIGIASVPPAPGRFSTCTFCCRCRLASSASRRIVRSVAPPAGQGTHRVIGRDVNTSGTCARASGASSAASAAAPRACSERRREGMVTAMVVYFSGNSGTGKSRTFRLRPSAAAPSSQPPGRDGAVPTCRMPSRARRMLASSMACRSFVYGNR